MKIQHAALTVALALGSSVAFAGLTSPTPVTVTVSPDRSGTAGGNMATARRSADSVTYIGCGIRYIASATGIIKGGFCQASTSAGVAGICSFDASELTNSLAMIADNSYISFNWNAAGVCTRIGVSTQSFYLP